MTLFCVMEQYKNIYDMFKCKVFESDYDFIRNNKKFNFWINTGNIKISTIHSFKGWESDTIFLILQKKERWRPVF